MVLVPEIRALVDGEHSFDTVIRKKNFMAGKQTQPIIKWN
jgi:hypothetical protein